MFTLNKKQFSYFDHHYNNTRVNERRVEVAVALYLYSKGKDVLEIGAVLPHYLENPKHTCVDLHEEFPGVINQNILSFEPDQEYDLIISISTLDHLNSEEEVERAVDRMRGWIKPGGMILCTVPYGQTFCPWIDYIAAKNLLEMDAVWRMDKVAPSEGGWEQVAHDKPPLRYNWSSICASTVYFMLDGPIRGWW